jgi:hypothetical protein
VLEDDGTEVGEAWTVDLLVGNCKLVYMQVEEDDYFQTLEDNTTLMLLYQGER